MFAQIVNSFGLLLDIAGVVIVFKYGWPQPDLEGKSFLMLEGDAAGDEEVAAHRKRQHIELSTLGLFCLVVGFLLQIGATWL